MLRILLACAGALVLGAAVVSQATGDDRKAAAGKASKPEPLPVLRTLKTESEQVRAVCFSPDGRVLAVAEEGRIAFWDPRTGKATTAPWKVDPDPPVRTITFVGRGTVAIAQDTRHVVIREYPSGKTLHTLRLGFDQHAMSLAAADGVLVAASNNFVRAWGGDWKERWCITPARGDAPFELALLSNRDELAVGVCGDRGRLQIYSMKDGKALRSAGADKHVLPSFHGLAYSPNEQLLAVAPTSHPNPGGERPSDVLGMTVFEADLAKHQVQLRWAVADGDPYWCAFTPDGKTLIVVCRSGDTRFTGRVRFYEVKTGRLRHVGEAPVSPVTLSPDGSLLAFGPDAGSKAVVSDWRAWTGARAEPTGAELSALWGDLASSDSGVGFRAVVRLGASPEAVVRLIREKLKPVPAPKAEVVRNFIADLGAEDFATRERAEQALAALGGAVEPELRTAARDGNPDQRTAAARLLKSATRPEASERLRASRAVELLEYLGTEDAREQLQALAAGAPGAALTRDAKAALARLARPLASK